MYVYMQIIRDVSNRGCSALLHLFQLVTMLTLALLQCSSLDPVHVTCRFEKLENGPDGRDAAVVLGLQLASLDVKS